MVTPGEAHWLLGIEERCIQTLKRTVARLEKEELGMTIEDLFQLAVHGHNSHVHHGRQRLRQGRGGWTGPLRVLLQEGSTVWLATGATLVRAKTNQCGRAPSVNKSLVRQKG